MAANKNLKSCVHCARSVHRLAARGLCPACYYREKRNGSLDYVKVRKPCSVSGCEHLSIAQGYCETHYRRLLRHGVAEAERFDKWGHASQHPLQNAFSWMRRSSSGAIVPEWSDFWRFVADVGERPTSKHKLTRVDAAKPYGPDNVYWKPPAVDATLEQLAGKNAYMRAYRARNPQQFKDRELRKQFGMSLEEYERISETQGHCCAICREPERAINAQTGLPRRLAVDHCHKSHAVRGLLCSHCNTGLGSFSDNPETLRAAIEYLERHAPPPSPTG